MVTPYLAVESGLGGIMQQIDLDYYPMESLSHYSLSTLPCMY